MKKKIVLSILAISITVSNTYAAPTKGGSASGLVSRLTGGTNKALDAFKKFIYNPDTTFTTIREKLESEIRKAKTIEELTIIKEENKLIEDSSVVRDSGGLSEGFTLGRYKHKFKDSNKELPLGDRSIYWEIKKALEKKAEGLTGEKDNGFNRPADPSTIIKLPGHRTETVEENPNNSTSSTKDEGPKKPSVIDHISARAGYKPAQERIKKYRIEKEKEEERKHLEEVRKKREQELKKERDDRGSEIHIVE